MAYSSCSMNQIENEAVVAQVLYFITDFNTATDFNIKSLIVLRISIN